MRDGHTYPLYDGSGINKYMQLTLTIAVSLLGNNLKPVPANPSWYMLLMTTASSLTLTRYDGLYFIDFV